MTVVHKVMHISTPHNFTDDLIVAYINQLLILESGHEKNNRQSRITDDAGRIKHDKR